MGTSARTTRNAVQRRRLACSLVFVLVTLATSAQADPILFTHAQLFPNSGNDPGDQSIIAGGSGIAQVDISQRFENGVPVDTPSDPGGELPPDPYEPPGDPVPAIAVMEGTAGATADYGILRSYATVNLSDYAPATYWQSLDQTSIVHASSGMAGFRDTLEVLGAPADGGFLHFFFDVDGVFNGGGVGSSGGTLQMQNFAYQQGFYTTGSYNVEFAIPFVAGTPLDIEVGLLSYNVLFDLNEAGPYSYAGTADMAHTAYLSQILITGTNGNQILGASINSASGTQYRIAPPTGGVVPEPATFLLIGMGAAGALVRHRVVRRRA